MSKNHTKSARRLAENRKKYIESKRISTPEDLENFVSYATYCSLYINDCACNSCIDLESYLKKMTFKTKAPQILYNALMKRVHAYFQTIEECFSDNMNVFAEIFGEMDEYCVDKIDNFKKAVENCLISKNVENYQFYAKVEEMVDLCDLAVLKNVEIVKKISKVYPSIKNLHFYNIEEIKKVATELMNYVYTACPCKESINFNDDERIMIEFRRLDKTLFSKDVYEKAYNTAAVNLENESLKQ